MKKLDDAVKMIQKDLTDDEENAGLLAIASIIESNTGLGGFSTIRHQWSPVFRYIKNRYHKREMLFKIAAEFTQELGWADWMVNIFKTGKKPYLNLSELTPEDLNDPTPEQQAALDVEGWDKLDVVEFSGKPVAIAFSGVIHPGLNKLEVVDLDYETSEHFRPAVFNHPCQGKENTIGHIYIHHSDEGDSFIISEYIPNGTLTEMKTSLVTLAFRVEPATSDDHQQIAFEDRLEADVFGQQIEQILALEAIVEEGIPDLIRRTRKDRGWSQTMLGRKLGVSQQYVAAMESGSRSMPTELRQKFTNLLNQSPVANKLEDLITGGLSPQEIQRELAKMTRQATGKTPRGQLWQPCAHPDCDNEPVCLNCQKCEDEHCQCDE